MGLLEERQLRMAAILADFHTRQAIFISEEATKAREEANVTLERLATLDNVLDEMMASMICHGISPWRSIKVRRW